MVKPVIANGSVVAFDIGVLLRLSWLDMIEPNAMPLRPVGQRAADVLWPVVATNRQRLATPFYDLIERTDDPLGR